MDILEGNEVLAWFDLRIKTNELKYHSSWNLLMPIIDKIEALPANSAYGTKVKLEGAYCSIRMGGEINDSGEFYDCQYFKENVAGTKIMAAWLACIQFIQWYNQNK